MYLSKLYIEHFRNLSKVSLEDFGQSNLLFGENGSGKTSVLEAIYALGSARSFRTHKWRSLVSHGQTEFTVAGTVQTERGDSSKLGVRRSFNDNSAMVRIDGETVKAASALAQCLPLQVLDSATFSLLEGAPEKRRQLLDWLVFHVEPLHYIGDWQRYAKTLSHRNALLRSPNPRREDLHYWTGELAALGERLHQRRVAMFDAYVPVVEAVYQAINRQASQAVDITLHYYSGWEHDTDLATKLNEAIERDIELGYTRDGPHRADIRVKAGAKPALEVLSRGQLKSLIASFRLAQAKLLRQYGINSVVLVDDLAAELDLSRRQALCQLLTQLGLQVFYTSIDIDDLASCFEEPPKRFHVKHGQVIPQSQ